jgi:hypothetical protein
MTSPAESDDEHIDMRVLANRIATFAHLESELSNEEWAEYGFHYMFVADCVRCIHCGILLFNWKDCTNPKEEHARHSQTCPSTRSYKYDTFEKRLATFTDWADQKISKEELAVAGFYFKGPKDTVKCYSCGLELLNWDKHDLAWVDHAFHQPNCAHILKCKGASFVQHVRNIKINKPITRDTTVEDLCDMLKLLPPKWPKFGKVCRCMEPCQCDQVG